MPSSCKVGRLISNFRMKWTRCYIFTINITLRIEVAPWRDHWICCQVTKRPRGWIWIFKSTSCKWKVRLCAIYPCYVQPFLLGPCHSRKFKAPRAKKKMLGKHHHHLVTHTSIIMFSTMHSLYFSVCVCVLGLLWIFFIRGTAYCTLTPPSSNC